MRSISLGPSGLDGPAIAVGCMRLDSLDATAAERFVRTAIDLGAVFFDHADIYGDGRCEEIFGEALGSGVGRDTVQVQSKCGIRPGAFDFSYEHIVESVEGSLRRLRTDHLDVLLLHRPDALVEPGEVARAFDDLETAGKVRHFGVSNHRPGQIELLRRHVRQPIVANQLQLSITNASMITSGLHVNRGSDDAADRDGGVLDYCRLRDITIQPWSPLHGGFSDGVFVGSATYPELNSVLDDLAATYDVSATTIALAWILRHPARMQPVTGTTKVERLAECAAATHVTLTREEWYALYLAAGHTLP